MPLTQSANPMPRATMTAPSALTLDSGAMGDVPQRTTKGCSRERLGEQRDAQPGGALADRVAGERRDQQRRARRVELTKRLDDVETVVPGHTEIRDDHLAATPGEIVTEQR